MGFLSNLLRSNSSDKTKVVEKNEETLKTKEGIEKEIKNVMNMLDNMEIDHDARNFYNGKLIGLRWVLKLEV